jgi:putative resolvase
MNTSNIKNYKPKDFAELLGVSVKTLQRWDREGTLKANRPQTYRHYYTYNHHLLDQVAFLRYFCNAKELL